MKKQVTLITALLVIVFGCSLPEPASSQNKQPDNRSTPSDPGPSPQAQAMKELRDKLLASSAEDLGLSKEHREAKVWGVLMEVAFAQGVATVVSVRDGTASLYTSTGGGVLGGYSAQKQAKRFVAEAEKHLAGMKATKTFPYPAVGQVKFYVLTREGVYSSEVAESELVGKQHALSPLFLAANDVLTGLRAASGRAKP